MTGSTAGYVDARPVMSGALSQLATLQSPVPVLGLYLGLDPNEFGTQPARGSAITSLLDTAHNQIEDHDTSHRGRASLRADQERTTAFFDEFSPRQTRGMAIFAAGGAEIFQPYLLPRPTRTRVVIDAEVPTVGADDVRRAAFAVFEQDEARHEHKLIERLAARLATGRGGVAGIDDVRDALVQRRVETLLYDERRAPPESVLESAIKESVVQSAAIVPVRHTPDALDQHGHIAAVLRF